MTKEELEKEAEKSCIDKTHYCIGGFGGNAYCEGYIDSAEPREKRIAELEAQNKELQNGNFVLTVNEIIEGKDKKIAELEAQIEKMKCCENCTHHYYIALDDITHCKLLDRLASSKPCDKWEIKEND